MLFIYIKVQENNVNSVILYFMVVKFVVLMELQLHVQLVKMVCISMELHAAIVAHLVWPAHLKLFVLHVLMDWLYLVVLVHVVPHAPIVQLMFLNVLNVFLIFMALLDSVQLVILFTSLIVQHSNVMPVLLLLVSNVTRLVYALAVLGVIKL